MSLILLPHELPCELLRPPAGSLVLDLPSADCRLLPLTSCRSAPRRTAGSHPVANCLILLQRTAGSRLTALDLLSGLLDGASVDFRFFSKANCWILHQRTAGWRFSADCPLLLQRTAGLRFGGLPVPLLLNSPSADCRTRPWPPASSLHDHWSHHSSRRGRLVWV